MGKSTVSLIKSQINSSLVSTPNFRLAKLISQVEWSKTGINFIIDSDYSPWIWKQSPSSLPPEEDDSALTALTMKKFHVSLGEVK